MTEARVGRWMTLIGFFGLFFVILAFTAVVAPPERLPRSLVLALLLVPLLFPLRGLLHGRRYTHAWTSLLALFYIALGITLAAVPAERLYGLSMLFSAGLLFAGALLYIRGNRRPT